MKKLTTTIKEVHDHCEGQETTNEEDSLELGTHVIQHANQLFFRLHQTQIEVTFVFFQMKIIEVRDKYNEYKIMSQYIERGNQHFLYLLQSLYIETNYVKNLYEFNVEGERKALKKHKKMVSGTKMPTPLPSAPKLNKLKVVVNDLINNLEDLYIQSSSKNVKNARLFLRELVKEDEQSSTSSFIFGVGIGIAISIIVLIIVLLNNAGIGIDSDKQFIRDFPVWRGLAIFIIYYWVLGLNVYAFQQYHINHKQIFKFDDYHASKSTEVFGRASLFTSLYLGLFLLYVLQRVTGQDYFGIVSRKYLGLMLWILLFLNITLPIPIFNYKGRKYMWKLFLTSVISPLYIVDFSVVWMTDQFVSLTNPLKDMAYTICYYTRIDFSNPTASNPCSSSSNVEIVFIVGMVVLVYRMLQCIRLGYTQGVYFKSPHFFNTLKYAASLMTLLLSYLYNAASPNIFAAWVISAAISTIFSYGWDLKMDWNLLESGAKHRFLRQQLVYGDPKFYYCIMVINFILRLSWIFTLSPGIVAALNIRPVMFTLLSGTLQIIRRGVWNLLRVQKQHIINCEKLKALYEQEDIRKRIQEDPANTSLNRIVPETTIEVLRRKKLRQNLDKRVKQKKKLILIIEDFLESTKKKLKMSLKSS